MEVKAYEVITFMFLANSYICKTSYVDKDFFFNIRTHSPLYNDKRFLQVKRVSFELLKVIHN